MKHMKLHEKEKMVYREECYLIRGALYEVYAVLGPGFLEEVYQEALEKEFTMRNIPFESQVQLTILFKGEPLSKTYKADFLCFEKIIIELKAVKSLLPNDEAQLINYLKATKKKLGFLVNFCHFPKADIRTYAN